MGLSLPAEPKLDTLTEITITKPGSDHEVHFVTNLPGAPTATVADEIDGSVNFTLKIGEGLVSVTISPVAI